MDVWFFSDLPVIGLHHMHFTITGYHVFPVPLRMIKTIFPLEEDHGPRVRLPNIPAPSARVDILNVATADEHGQAAAQRQGSSIDSSLRRSLHDRQSEYVAHDVRRSAVQSSDTCQGGACDLDPA